MEPQALREPVDLRDNGLGLRSLRAVGPARLVELHRFHLAGPREEPLELGRDPLEEPELDLLRSPELALEVLRGVHLDDAAVVDHREPVAEVLGLLQDVRREEYREPFADLLLEVVERVPPY